MNFISDFTEQHLAEAEHARAEEQLRQAQKMEALGTLAGGIAHDFNNILSAIIGYAELAMEDAQQAGLEAKSISEILKAGERARDLVIQILTFSRKLEPETRPVNLNEVVRQTERMLSRTIPRMIEIELRLEEDLWLTQADPGQLLQVLMNLATNAVDAMPEGGQLLIETENLFLEKTLNDPHLRLLSGDYVKLRVVDTGHGMDRQTMDQMFDPFFTRKGVGKGTGLGLATVYGIVKNHRGSIICRSEPGQGTAFQVYLPAAPAGWQEVSQTGSPEEVVVGGRETLLLVDDEQPIRDLSRELLARQGYRILLAASGEEALDVYREQGDEIDLVVLDVSMPGMGGLRCLQELRTINPELKVIIASGYSLNNDPGGMLASEASAFILKPFSRIALLGSVREVLDR